MYSRKAKSIVPQTWKGLMNATSESELLETINAIEAGKAAGYDGLSIDLLKFVVSDPKRFPNSLKALLFLINFALRRGPLRSWKHAIITLIPKEGADGVEDFRPISVLPEISKICSRILTNRLGIMLQNSSVLNEAQRGFLRDGGVMQCLNVLIDVFEDAKENKRELFCVSYDIEKAYDSIQLYSIVASLERFNLPSGFISFVKQGLENASSQFKTPYGLTKGFALRSSVRQGDPLAPFLFILIADALHDGLLRSPLFPSSSSGYRLQTDPSISISSLGYADDTCIFAENWEVFSFLGERILSCPQPEY